MREDVFLIIDDQKSIALFLKDQLEQLSPLPVLTCHSLAEAKAVLNTDINVVVCLSDLHLPDAPRGEAIDLLNSRHITTVVLTGSYSEEIRKEMFQKKVADYVIKDNPSSIRYALQTVITLYKNAQRTLWILTSGQSAYSNKLVGLLRIHRFQVKLFESPEELSTQLAKSQPDLILLEDVDNIRHSNIYEFINKVRERFSQNQLPMMACEPSDNIATAIKMMKYGVNDFFNTTFTVEELYVRIKQNIDHACAYNEIEYISQRDALTGAYNRGYFFKQGHVLFNQLKQMRKYFFVVMADIDHFKLVNDNHGHQKGDEAIIFMADTLQTVFADFLVARFGGEEFCVLGEAKDATQIEALCEQLRAKVETESQQKVGIPFTVSQGLTFSGDDLEGAIARADKALYRSKEQGRNRVSVEF
jgi:diguanylate cyclase (GGDEF)-like protein